MGQLEYTSAAGHHAASTEPRSVEAIVLPQVSAGKAAALDRRLRAASRHLPRSPRAPPFLLRLELEQFVSPNDHNRGSGAARMKKRDEKNGNQFDIYWV